MRTIFTSIDVKNIIENVFKSDETKIMLYDGNMKNGKEVKLIDYLNIEFYSWRNRLVETQGESEYYEDWLASMNYSLDKGFALVELNDSSVTPSQDVDSATLSGKVTFLIQTNKVANLDLLVSKIRNEYLGKPQEIITYDGKKLKSYISIGIVLYDEEPDITTFGETCVVSLNFAISYLTNASTYNDTIYQFSFNDVNYYDIPITKATIQKVVATQNVPQMARPDLTGAIGSAITNLITFSFFNYLNNDFLVELTTKFNTMGALQKKVNGVWQNVQVQEVNIPVYLKVNDEYKYKLVISHLEKVVTNSDFDIMSMSLMGYAR